MLKSLAWLFVGLLLTSNASADTMTGRTVRVAAVQCYSRMGAIEYNRALLTSLAREAATNGARIVVLPECAITGYMDPANQVIWTTNAVPDEGQMSIQTDAEPVPGKSTEHFAKLSKKLSIYLCIALAEKADGRIFNSQVLLNPEGKIIGHHRKRSLWTPGDGLWVSQGNRPIQVVETEYGRLGLMICHDVHVLPELLGKEKADIVLYSVGWYGPNTENWYKSIFPRKYVVPNGFSIIVANWSADKDSPGWPGHGYSCVIDRDGRVLSMAKSQKGSEIVYADLPLAKTTQDILPRKP